MLVCIQNYWSISETVHEKFGDYVIFFVSASKFGHAKHPTSGLNPLRFPHRQSDLLGTPETCSQHPLAPVKQFHWPLFVSIPVRSCCISQNASIINTAILNIMEEHSVDIDPR
jgi:hypothetical protein